MLTFYACVTGEYLPFPESVMPSCSWSGNLTILTSKKEILDLPKRR